ncbi:MAG TPA: hypothetical protein VHO70_03385 [Chitinispirillaceae bacterium]|nr:hypothetical protein [Chitinispirillaceae bacterium]
MNQKPCVYLFSDYIKSLSADWIQKHFLSTSDGIRMIVSSNVIDNAVRDFSQAENLNSRFDELSECERLRCALIYLSGNAGLRCDRDDPLDDPLVKSFLAFAAYDADGATRLFGFDEFVDSISEKIVTTIIKTGKSTTVQHVAPHWKYRPLNEVVILCALAAQAELKLGKNGKFSRTTILKLKKLIDTTDPKSDTTEFLARLIISYCVSKEIVGEHEQEIQFYPGGMGLWVKEDRDSRLEDCREYTISRFGDWRLQLLKKIGDAAAPHWIDLRIFPENDREDAFNAVRTLKFAGILEYIANENEIFFQLAESFSMRSDQIGAAIVQADFTAMIPQESNADEIFHFAQAGELLSLDKVFKGKLSKEVLANSLSRGVDSSQITAWLEQHQAPANVLETVKEWIREFFRLFITERVMLVSGEEKVSRQIESYEPLKNCLEIVPAHSVYQIKRGCEDKVKEILTGLGFDYRKPGDELTADIVERMRADESFMMESRWRPVTEARSEEKKKMSAMRGTKYGEELKALDINEIIHVIDYAVLTGRNLILDYEGSPYLKPGVYTVLPLSCRKGMDPILEAELLRTKSRKQFYVKKIRKIGVESE